MTESERFLEIDRLRVAKLEKLRHMEAEAEVARVEKEAALDLLAKERELNLSLIEQNRAVMNRLDSLSADFEAEKAVLLTKVEQSAHSESCRIEELKSNVSRAQTVIEGLRAELENRNDASGVLEVENKSLKAALATKQSDFNLQLHALKKELTDQGCSKDKVIAEQRALIDQLSNSMSEAATQLMESQNVSKYHQSDIESRDRKISALEEKVMWLEDNVRDRTERLIAQEDVSKELSKRIDQLVREKEIVLGQLEACNAELANKDSIIQSLESFQKKSNLIQTNLVSELQSLPIINKRLESDCSFLRDDLKSVSERLKNTLKEMDAMASRIKIVDSILLPEQRLKVNEKSTQGSAPIKSEATAVAENKKLQIEAMELRMRLVDSQAARDKAQAQLIEQSQLIGKIQKELRSDENVSRN